jgi:hypothetical protein
VKGGNRPEADGAIRSPRLLSFAPGVLPPIGVITTGYRGRRLGPAIGAGNGGRLFRNGPAAGFGKSLFL